MTILITPKWPNLIRSLVIWLAASGTGYCGSLTAWNNGLSAPQLVMYDSATGQIFYSLCNSDGIPTFPVNDTAAFHLDIPPVNGTSVAGTGYEEEGHYVVRDGLCLQEIEMRKSKLT